MSLGKGQATILLLHFQFARGQEFIHSFVLYVRRSVQSCDSPIIQPEVVQPVYMLTITFAGVLQAWMFESTLPAYLIAWEIP